MDFWRCGTVNSNNGRVGARSIKRSCTTAREITATMSSQQKHSHAGIRLWARRRVLLLHRIFDRFVPSGARGEAAIKLDMSKVYDRVEWFFSREMRRRMGFAEQWIALIMKCVTTMRYRVKVNGDLPKSLIPQRGLRHLPTVCWSLFRAAEERGTRWFLIAGVKFNLSQCAKHFRDLLFADDSNYDSSDRGRLQANCRLSFSCMWIAQDRL